MEFLGMSIVEDALQENVPETISKLKEAGIKTWILTGDKLETALYVARNCKLAGENNSSEILKIIAVSDEAYKKRMSEVETHYPDGV
jgi:phospholipid-translocating ATPase